MKKVSLLVSLFALVFSASCTKQNIDQPEFDADDLEVVFEELSEDGTKAAVTQVDLDVSGDFLPSSRTLTATLRYKTSKTPITQGVIWSWGKSFDGVNYDLKIHSATGNQQKIDAVSVGKGTVSTVATYKGQEVSSPTVDVNVTDNELESIEIVGSGLVVPDGLSPAYYAYVNINDRPNFPQPTLETESATPVITCLYSPDYSSTPLCTHPRLFVKTVAHFKGRSETKELKVSDGVSYTFPDDGKDFTITKESSWITLSSYDSYCVGYPDFSSTEAGFKSNYYGDHTIKAKYKDIDTETKFSIVFDHKYFETQNFKAIYSINDLADEEHGPDTEQGYLYIYLPNKQFEIAARYPFLQADDMNYFTFVVTRVYWKDRTGLRTHFYLKDKTDPYFKLTPISAAGGLIRTNAVCAVLNDYLEPGRTVNLYDWSITMYSLNESIFFFPQAIVNNSYPRN